MLLEQMRRRTTMILGGAAAILLAIAVQPVRAQDALRPGGVKQVGVGGLSPSVRHVVFDRTAFFGQTTALPRWDKNYLVSWEVLTYQGGVPNVRLYNRDGQKVREAAIWFPDSQRVIIRAAAATSNGGILVAGSAEKADGTAASFIAFADSSGKIASVIQTKGFAPSNICEAPDHTVWTFGGTGYDRETGPRPGNTLRHFDLEKGELSSFLPRSLFPDYPMPDKPAYITCSAVGVSIYSPGAQAYIEVAYEGGPPHMYHVTAPDGFLTAGFAVTDAKSAYAYFYKTDEAGLYRLLFDEEAKTAAWAAVDGTVGPLTKPGAVSGLWGADGGHLVVSRSDDGAHEVVHWATPIERQ